MNNQSVTAKFSAIAHSYEQAAFIEQEIGQRLISNLQELNLTPKYILDLGCGTGLFTTQIMTLFPQAQIIGLDLSLEMVKIATQKHNLNAVCANGVQMPFANLQFDLVIANCCIPIMPLLSEIQRILKIDGLFVCSSMGPDTFHELSIVNDNWLDMHILGDILLQQNFKDPIVNAEKINFNYPNIELLLEDLQESGHDIEHTSITSHDSCAVTVEAIYVMAWKTVTSQFRDDAGNIFVNIDTIQHLS